MCRKTIAITDCGELKEKILLVCYTRYFTARTVQKRPRLLLRSARMIASQIGSACVMKIEFSIFISRFPR